MAIKVNGTTVIDDNRNLVNIASGAGGGYWNELSSVTLGGSVVSGIAVTLPAGYNVHKIDFRFPMPSNGSYGEALMFLRNSSSVAQTFSYTRFLSYNNGNSSQQQRTDQEWAGYIGGFSATNYWFGSLIIYDALSSSANTRWLAQGALASGFYNERMAFTGGGFQNTAGTITSALFEYASRDFGTGSNLYYKLYGHTYA